MSLLRLDKLLADQGIASRKEARELIRSGRLKVDGALVTKPEEKVDPDLCRVEIDGVALNAQKYHYYMLDKPAGVVTAVEDRREKTVIDLVTDDGDFAHRVISPKSKMETLS